MRKFILHFVLIIVSISSFAQDQSNKGKDFWLTYPAHSAGTNSRMALYLTSDINTSGNVQYNGNTIPFNIVANQTTVVRIGNATAPSNAGCYIGTNNIVETNKGIHITALKSIVAYAHILNSAVSGSTLLLPKNVLGQEYVVSTYVPQGSTFGTEKCQFVIVGVENNTTVEITPKSNDISGSRLAGVPFQITLNQGDVYQFQSFNELSGSKVVSVSNTGSCKKIVVFGSTTRSAIGCGTASSGDNLFQQLTPIPSWGKNYITVPFALKNRDIIRIYVSNTLTPVIVNAVPLPLASLINNSYYEYSSNTPQEITSTEGIAVYQYIITQNCDAIQSDPEMILINALEQTLNDLTFVSAHQGLTPPNTNISSHYVNVTFKNTGTALSSLRVDGLAPAVVFTPIGTTNYVYAQINLTASTSVANPDHRITCDSGFIAIAYGYGNVESYGFNAGTNIKDLYQQIGVSTEYGIDQAPSVCTGAPFRFKVSLPYQPDSIFWNLSSLPGIPPNVMMYYPPSVPDSSTIVNGKTIYWYSLPNIYTFGTVGVFPVTITTYSTSAATCGSEQDIDFDLQVSDPPVAGFNWTLPGCPAETVQFTDNTTSLKPTYKWWWNFGDPASGAANTSGLKNPTHIFSAPGTYTVRYSNITTPGCLSDTISNQVIVPAFPSATISGTASLCLNTPNPVITFTALNGVAPYAFTYNINGGPNQIINTVAGNTVTITAPTNTVGIFSYNLVSVRNISTPLCTQNQTGSAVVTINPFPTASITGNTTVCLNAASPNITFTGATGTAPYIFTYNINGGSSQTITTTVGNTVTLPVATNIAGTFIYNLVSVQDGTSAACSQNQTGVSTIIVKDLPTAIIAGATNVCLNATSPNITFTGSLGTAPYTFTYNINGGPSQIITTTAGNSVTLAVPTSAAGTFTYNLVSVSEGSANACSQLQSGSSTIIVNPLPTANITGTASVCLNAASPAMTFTGASSLAPYTFTYNINGGPNLTVSSIAGNTATVTVATNVAGLFTYNLLSVLDGSSTACSSTQSGSAIITVKPLPTATIAGSTSACFNGALPIITFTGALGIAPYTFTYNINGGPNQTVSTTIGNSVTVAISTAIVGTLTYNLISVQEGSATICSQNQTGSAVVIINPLPTATINGSTALCLNTPSPNITFTGAAGIAPYTFTYNINGGPSLTITTTAGNTASIVVPTNVAGTFTYNLVSVRDASASLCSQAQIGNAVVIIHPFPTANFSISIPSCETRLATFTDNSIANAGAITTWSWTFGDPASGSNNTSALQNPTHTFSTAGNYTVSLVVTTSNSCSNILFTKIVTINARPKAGYIIPEVCLSDTYAQFTDTSKVANGTITGWEWNFGDPAATVPNPNTSTLQNPQHSYTAVGSYNVQLISTTNNGCKDTITQVLAINGSFPVANFTVNNPTTLCANDSVAIVNTSSVFPGIITRVEIYWDNTTFPAVLQIDDEPFSGKVYKHKYPNFQSPLTRIFTIRYRAYSGGVCVNDRISNITVNAAPRVQFNAIPNACFDAIPFQITQASEVGAVPGTFVFTGPGISASGLFNPVLAGIGTHTIKYTFTSTAGGCVDSMSQNIKVLDTATAKFTFISPACDGTAATFREESTAPSGVTLNNTVWNFGDGTPLENHAPGTTFTHLFPAWGAYTVTMYNTSASGCRSTSKAQSVYINPIPQTSFSFVESSVCLPAASVSFVNNSIIADGTENAFTYAWNFGDPASGSLNTSLAKTPPPHIYRGAGPFTVSLTVTSGSSCKNTFTRVVNFIHPQPKAAFTISKPGICIGDNVIFSDITDGLDGTVQEWNWNFGDGVTGNTKQVQILYTTAKTFDVSLFIKNSQGCNSDTLIKQFTVHPFPVVDAGPGRVVLQGGAITIQPLVTGNDLQYLWSPSTYLNSTTTATPKASNVQADIIYKLTVTARGGCKSEDTMFVKVLLAPRIPNTFTPNGDGINEVWAIDYLDTYPNNRVQVFNRAGQLVFESRGYKQPWNGTMNGKSLPFDTYYYIIEPESGRKPVTGYVTIIK